MAPNWRGDIKKQGARLVVEKDGLAAGTAVHEMAAGAGEVKSGEAYGRGDTAKDAKGKEDVPDPSPPHLGLAAEALTKPEETIWRVRGLPEELFPLDVDDAGLPVELDAVDEDLSEPFFDELPARDWPAWLGGLTVCWVAELFADRAD